MEHGIRYQTACVYTPQQNGVAKRDTRPNPIVLPCIDSSHEPCMNPSFTSPHQPDVSQHLDQSHPTVEESPYVIPVDESNNSSPIHADHHIPVDESNNSSTIHADHHNSTPFASPEPVFLPPTLPISSTPTKPDSSVTAHPSPHLEPTHHSTRPT
ncbi:unnamed protein product [Prunus armeniaca]